MDMANAWGILFTGVKWPTHKFGRDSVFVGVIYHGTRVWSIGSMMSKTTKTANRVVEWFDRNRFQSSRRRRALMLTPTMNYGMDLSGILKLPHRSL